MPHQLSPVLGLPLFHLVTSQPSPGTAKVAVTGEVDLSTAAVLRDRLLQVLRERAVAVLDVDFAGVTFLDCCGVGALVAVRDVAVRTGVQMRVTNLQRIVRLVLDLVGLLGVLAAPVDVPHSQLPDPHTHPVPGSPRSGGLGDGLRGEYSFDLVE